MEIRDPQAIYRFLSSLSWFGSIALFIMLALVVAFIALNISEKLFESKSKNQKRFMVSILALMVIVCGIVLKNDANNSRTQLRDANAIKSYLLEVRHRYKSLRTIANDILLGSGNELCKGDSA